MTKRKGRKSDAPVTHTPEQTTRYKSQLSRYQKGLELAGKGWVHKISDSVFRVESARSPVGYWEITTLLGGEITVNWEGQTPYGEVTVYWAGFTLDSGEITVNWEGRTPYGNCDINVRWQGKSTDAIPYPLSNATFKSLAIGGCSVPWSFRVAYPFKNGGIPETLDNVIAAYKRAFPAASGFSANFILASSGGTGIRNPFSYGFINQSVGLTSFSEGGNTYGSLYYIIEINTVGTATAILNAVDSAIAATPLFSEISFISPSSRFPSANCDLSQFYVNASGVPQGQIVSWDCVYNTSGSESDVNWTIYSDNQIQNSSGFIKNLIPCAPPQAGLSEILIQEINTVSCTGGILVSFPCVYFLDESEFSYSWTIFSNNSIKNNSNLVKVLIPCEPPELLTSIKLKNIVSVISTKPGGGSFTIYSCTYPLEESEFSYTWYPYSTNSIINEFSYIKTLLPCDFSEPLTGVSLYDNPISVVRGDDSLVSFPCKYILNESEFSYSWTIISSDSIKNDSNLVKVLTPCEPPQALQSIGLKSIVSVVGLGDGYTCTCPDFSKREDAFNPPPFESMSQPRNWQSSQAGCPTWEDGKRRCYHIVAVQTIKKESIPTPKDL